MKCSVCGERIQRAANEPPVCDRFCNMVRVHCQAVKSYATPPEPYAGWNADEAFPF